MGTGDPAAIPVLEPDEQKQDKFPRISRLIRHQLTSENSYQYSRLSLFACQPQQGHQENG